ncbi:MAG: Holliday junction branch migration protein RuvA [Verrucomicrobiota bacterium]|nr:Holliday junction branch migration protein RuvA [Verrucomicrobiota bacterium]
MIASLCGRLIELDFTRIVIDVNGVGYEVFIPMSTYDKLPKENEEASLLIHTAVREDAITLYGFKTVEEKQLFLMLTSVSGIGPKLGLNILSAMPVAVFCQHIADSAIKPITRISGLGQKTAARLIVELKDKAKKLLPFLTHGMGTGAQDVKLSNFAEDAVAALETLGFKGAKVRKTISKLIKSLPEEKQTTEDFIKSALQNLNG